MTNKNSYSCVMGPQKLRGEQSPT